MQKNRSSLVASRADESDDYTSESDSDEQNKESKKKTGSLISTMAATTSDTVWVSVDELTQILESNQLGDESVIDAETAKAKPVPPEWQDDVLGFYESGTSYNTGTDQEPAEFVILLRTTNTVARQYILERAARNFIYTFYYDKGDAYFETTDKALSSKLGEEGIRRVAEEIVQRKEELINQKVLIPAEATASSGSTVVDPRIAKFLSNVCPYNVDHNYFYARHPDTRFRCIREELIPSNNEVIDAYLESHDGHGGAIPVPISFWNPESRRLAPKPPIASAPQKQ